MSIHFYKVGGCVRDTLLRKEGVDIPEGDVDRVVTGATPEDMTARGFMPVGADFPVFLHPETHEEYALARTERKTARGYHGFAFYAAPDVTLEEDLRRRDLTVNAIAQAPDGTLIDPWGGERDIRARVLRHVSEAFCEDPVRILRLARFAARFPEFTVAPETTALCRRMVEAGEVDALVAERTWQELSRGLSEKAPVRMIEVLESCGAWARLFPDVPVPGAVRAALTRAARAGLSVPVRTALLFSSLTDPVRLRERLRALRVQSETISLCEVFCRLHDRAASLESAEDFTAFLEEADVLRRPQRFEEMLAASSTLAPENNFERLTAASEAFRAVDAGAAARSARGKAVARAVRGARLAAVAAALAS